MVNLPQVSTHKNPRLMVVRPCRRRRGRPPRVVLAPWSCSRCAATMGSTLRSAGYSILPGPGWGSVQEKGSGAGFLSGFPPSLRRVAPLLGNTGRGMAVACCDERLVVAIIFVTWFSTNLTINFYNKYGPLATCCPARSRLTPHPRLIGGYLARRTSASRSRTQRRTRSSAGS